MSIDLRERISKKEKKAVFYSSKLSNRPNIKRLSLDKVVECLSSTKADVFVISCYYGFETIQKFFDKIYGKQENQQETTVIVSSQGNSLDRMISILKKMQSLGHHIQDRNYGMKWEEYYPLRMQRMRKMISRRNLSLFLIAEALYWSRRISFRQRR